MDNKTHWTDHEKMMASAYANIASSLSQIKSFMQNHLRPVRVGRCIITDGDIEEVLQQLSNMINKNLHNVSQIRVNFTIEKIPSQKPTSVTPTENNQNNDLKTENRKRNVVRLTESKLKQIVAESVRKVLRENGMVENKYKLIAYLIDPNIEYQKQSLGNDYEKSLRDFSEVERGGRSAISIMLQYRIDSNVTETFDSNDPYIIDRDGDGFYLFKKM